MSTILNRRALVGSAIALGAFCAVNPTQALGVTAAQKQAEVRAVKSQLEAMAGDVSAAGDRYHQAMDAYSDATARVEEAQATLFVYETSLTDDAEKPLQRGKQLYYSEDGQPILLLCNISDIVPNTEVELYPSTGEELVFSPFLSGENGHVVEAEGVCDFTIYPEGDDWETDTSPWSLEGNWLEIYRDTDEGVFDTAPEDADRMCFLPTDTDTEGSQLPFTASYITPYPELNVEEADLFYQEGTPEVPFQTNQEWYATFTGEDGSRYAVTLEDEDTLALKVYLEGQESYLSLVNTVYFARQEAMG